MKMGTEEWIHFLSGAVQKEKKRNGPKARVAVSGCRREDLQSQGWDAIRYGRHVVLDKRANEAV